MKNKKLSIIIASYNSQNTISKCIDSIYSQNYKNIEVIVVDDASIDSTYEICKKQKQKYKSLVLIKNETNMGVSVTRNIGIEKASGDLITFVDADDFIEKNIYVNIINGMQSSKVELGMCNFFMDKNGKDIRKKVNSDINLSKDALMSKIFLSDYFGGFVWNKIYFLKIIRENKIRFSEKIHICEDLLFNIEYINFIKNGIYFDDKYYHYVQYDNSSYTRYSKKWLSVIDAYEEIYKYVNQNSTKNYRYSYLYSLLNLKEKILNSGGNANINMINKKIKENKKGVYLNKDIDLKTKIKIFLKLNMINIFILFKK